VPAILCYNLFTAGARKAVITTDANEKYEYWLDTARYDLDTADAMFASGRWFYVAFMCQQAVEKLVKGLYVIFVDDNVPRVHAMRQVLRAFEDKLPVPVSAETYRLFDELTTSYLNGRYAEYKSR
jgi:HEPN domain-containing protein